MMTLNNRSKITVSRFLKRNFRLLSIFGIFALIPLVYLLVYYTGGIKFVFSHTMYIPILLAGILIGAKFGLLAGLIAGILLGPMMPIDTISNEPQLFINWFYRLIIFVAMGGISGYASEKLRKSAKKINQLFSHNQETQIPNTNYITNAGSLLETAPQLVATILINNHNSIIDVLGTDVYYKLLYDIYSDLNHYAGPKGMVVQSESNKLWVVKKYIAIDQEAMILWELLNRHREIDDIPMFVDYAIGLHMVSDSLECAKPSCYRASDASARLAQSKNIRYVIFDESIMRNRLDYQLIAVFAIALKQNQTFLMYQPIINLQTMEPIGLEALLRWQHPDRGVIYPDEFIPLVEKTKLIHQMTDWVLKNALKKIWEFNQDGLTIPVSINISAKNLYDPAFFERSMKIIDDSQLPPNLIAFEITESVLMINPDESRKVLGLFKDQGIKIAIDDFGKGYSSLAYLCQFPINIIKIDKFFMRQIMENESAQQIVAATINLSKQLGYKVVAEGIEEEEVAKKMQEFACDYAQGYFFARPMTDDKIIGWYKENQKNET